MPGLTAWSQGDVPTSRLNRAYEVGDVHAVAALADDVWLTMPPVPLKYEDLALAETFLRP